MYDLVSDNYKKLDVDEKPIRATSGFIIQMGKSYIKSTWKNSAQINLCALNSIFQPIYKAADTVIQMHINADFAFDFEEIWFSLPYLKFRIASVFWDR